MFESFGITTASQCITFPLVMFYKTIGSYRKLNRACGIHRHHLGGISISMDGGISDNTGRGRRICEGKQCLSICRPDINRIVHELPLAIRISKGINCPLNSAAHQAFQSFIHILRNASRKQRNCSKDSDSHGVRPFFWVDHPFSTKPVLPASGGPCRAIARPNRLVRCYPADSRASLSEIP
jgi:hypothetical protein